MSNMKNKVVALIISLIMLFDFFPFSALAEEEDVVIDKTESQTVNVLPEPEPEPEPETEPEVIYQESPLVYEGEDYTVTVQFGEDAGFLQGTELRVREILPGTAEYALYSGQTEEVLNENWDTTGEFARFFDITFIVKELDENGEEIEKEIEPQAPIDVQITFAEAIAVTTEEEEELQVQAIHFDKQEGAQVIESEAQSVEETVVSDDTIVDTVAFSSDSFSVYGFVQTAKVTRNIIAADGNTYKIEVTYDQHSEIPLNAELVAEEILPGTGQYDALLQEALKAAAAGKAEEATEPETNPVSEEDAEPADGETTEAEGMEKAGSIPIVEEQYARFFDIEIKVDGEKKDPSTNVSVSISLDDAPAAAAADELAVVHFAEAGTEVIEAQREGNEIQFEAETFSVYAVVAYTVDFYNDADGRTYEYHINGGSVQSLKELLPILKIVEDDPETEINEVVKFVENIEKVEFSDETLVKPVQVSEDTTAGAIIDALGVEIEYSADLTEEEIAEIKAMQMTAPDWALVSLRPFFTEESLTITFKDGKKMILKVTDNRDNAIIASPNDAGTIYVANTDQGSSVRNGYIGNSGGYNQRRIRAEAKAGYIFSKWKESDGTDITDLQDSTKPEIGPGELSMDIFDKRNHNLIAEFVTIKRILGIDDNYNNGRVTAPGSYTIPNSKGNQAWYDENIWNNGSGFNKEEIKAEPNQGYRFGRWEYYEETKNDVWTRNPSKDLYQSIYAPGTFNLNPNGGKGWFYKATFLPSGNIKVSVDKPSAGKLVDGNGNNCPEIIQLQNDGLPYTIRAISTDEKYVFGYWMLDGEILSITSDTLNQGELLNGSYLEAVFATVIDANDGSHSTIHVGTEKKEQFRRWLDSLEHDQTLSANKTAKVHDYSNRIYKVQIDAATARMSATANLGIAFILDASSSMEFPASLQRTGITMTLTQESLNHTFGNSEGPYYIISDPKGTSTVIRIYKANGTWYSIDASFTDLSKAAPIKWDSAYVETWENKKELPLAYPIYQDGGIGKRKDYLNDGLHAMLQTMRSIVHQVNSDSYKINVAYNTFAAYTNLQHGDGDNPNKFKWEDFKSLKDNNISVDLIDTDGGTRQDLGLQDACDFNWNSIDAGQKYAILITDGASVVGSKGTFDNQTLDQVRTNVETQATELKQKGVKLITVGLSTRNVSGGSEKLAAIASDNLFFEAETGEDLENILYEILQTVVKNATSAGKIEDVVDDAFYPVKADGTPIPRGTSYYNNNGEQITLEQYIALSPWGSRYKWEETNGKWKIIWESQYIGWNPTDSDPRKRPWQGTFYIKAKENFLGGNAIKTNDRCTVTEEAFTYRETLNQGRDSNGIDGWALLGNSGPSINPPAPHVNVDELALTGNSTEWTVYLGTEVDPKTQLKNLFEQIQVKEVVTRTAGGSHVTMTNANDTIYPIVQSDTDGRYAKSGASPETFPLSTVAPLNDDDWNTLIQGQSVEKNYTAYTHQAGKISYTLVKNVTEGEQGLENSPHDTAVTGQNVEQYTLTVTYVPTAANIADNAWHTTPGGTRGAATENMQSVNNHTINVFAKGLTIEKKDNNNQLITASPARFKLYRKAKANEQSSIPLTVGGNTINVVQVGEEIATNRGTATVDPLPYAPDGTYYLVETQAPAGYMMRSTPAVIQLNLSDKYWAWNQTENQGVGTLQDSLKPYNRKQTFNSITCDEEELPEVFGRANLHGPVTVINTPGVELPATGGPGTLGYILLGMSLILAAGGAIWYNKKKAVRERD